jgi:Undecaprenyl-phosphate galactose phosphotransferase WbaP
METPIATTSVPFSIRTIPLSKAVGRPFGTLSCLVVSDVVALASALLAGSLLRNLIIRPPVLPTVKANAAALVVLLCGMLAGGLYPGVNLNPVEELRKCANSITLGVFTLWSATFFLHDLSQSRLVYALAYVFALLLIPLSRSFVRSSFASCSWWGSAVAILGYGVTGKQLHYALLNNPRIGLKPVAILDDDSAKYIDLDRRLIVGRLSKCAEIAKSERIPYGIICMPGLSREELLNLVDEYGQCFGHLIVIPNLMGITSLGTSAREVAGIVGLEIRHPLRRSSSRLIKRGLDLALTLALALPVATVIAIFGILVTLGDGGQMFYASERIGRGGKPFKVWKLRSMMADGEDVLRRYLSENPSEERQWRANQKLSFDPRVTRIGALIRKLSIDELPQFWNILIGDMSMVGPRPILESQVHLYGKSFELYKTVRPGMTGLWQVSGRNHLTFAQRVNLDKYVIQNWSLWLDLYLLSRTVSVVLSAHGAY